MTAARGDGQGLGRVLAAGRVSGGAGLPRGTVRRFPTWGLTFVVNGSGRYRDPRHDVRVGAGTLITVLPGHPHWYGPERGGWDELFAVFDGQVFDLATRSGALSATRPVAVGLPVRAWQRRIAAVVARARPVHPIARNAEAVEVLALLLDAQTLSRPDAVRTVPACGNNESATPVPRTPETWLDRSRAMLAADLDTRLDLAEVATLVGLPYETWRRRFRAHVGAAPHAYRLQRRLDTTTELLTHTNRSVRDVAAATGFSDERHLIRRFRRRTGITPAEYRRHAGTDAGD